LSYAVRTIISEPYATQAGAEIHKKTVSVTVLINELEVGTERPPLTININYDNRSIASDRPRKNSRCSGVINEYLPNS
jgi:hypothetical protein